MGRQGASCLKLIGQIGATIAIAPPELPPEAALLTPNPTRLSSAEALAPQGWHRSLRGGGKALQQGSLANQPLQALGPGPGGSQQQASGKQQQQNSQGEGPAQAGHATAP